VLGSAQTQQSDTYGTTSPYPGVTSHQKSRETGARPSSSFTYPSSLVVAEHGYGKKSATDPTLANNPPSTGQYIVSISRLRHYTKLMHL
jgi:hypothetical protein